MVVMTSGAALYVADLAGTLKEGVEMSLQCVEKSSGLGKLEELVAYSQSVQKKEK